MRRNGFFRGWAVLWAVLQFALPAGVTLADARLEHESTLAPIAHVESTSDSTCRPSHPDECALCQFLSRAAPPAEHAALPEILVSVGDAFAALGTAHATHGVSRVSLPRAPPLSLA
jgi:hypothetical protein